MFTNIILLSHISHQGKTDISKNLDGVVMFVLQVQGLIISQMLRKSVETRDWVNTIEPRNVRAVMKRVVEDTTSIDVQVKLHHNVVICAASTGPITIPSS